MDLRIFYQKMRQVEAGISEPHVVVASLETPDGGKAGQLTEVARESAARLLVEGRARLATADEANGYREAQAAKKQAADAALASRTPVTLIGEPELKALKAALKSLKG